LALDIKKTAQFIKRCRAASGRVIRRFLGSHQGQGQLDFAIPESLHVLKMDVRRMVETELTPHNSLIEQEG
jgi:hypothetical protein